MQQMQTQVIITEHSICMEPYTLELTDGSLGSTVELVLNQTAVEPKVSWYFPRWQTKMSQNLLT